MVSRGDGHVSLMLRTLLAGALSAALACTLLLSCTMTPAPKAVPRTRPLAGESRPGHELCDRAAQRRALNKRRREDRLRDALQIRDQESRTTPDVQ